MARRALRGRRLAEDVRALEEELYVARADRDATLEALTHTRLLIRDAGTRGRRRGAALTIGGSEDAYRELLERRRDENAHMNHLRREVASIRQALIRARARARRAA